MTDMPATTPGGTNEREPVQPIPWVEVPIQVLATGFGFLEAPSFDRRGVLYFSEVRAGRVHRLDVRPPGTAPALFHQVASDWCNGTAFHRDGRLFLCDVGAGAIWSLSPDGKATVFADRCTQDGARLRGPNDLVFGRDGRLYFTDPRDSSLEQPIGAVYRATPDGAVERLAGGFAFPNGLALTPDEHALIVAETRTRRLYRFEIRADGSVGPRELFCQLPEDGGGPDGMALAADGSLYVCHIGAGCIDVVSPDGRVTRRIPTGGDRPSNCAFHGAALYATVTQADAGAIHRLDVGVPGHRLFGEGDSTAE
ncbi:MAG: SMP-30/gluconolactonase/LRE family protein [Chloroflexi bacterium]|nr:SMP-30/gluconolactonase/LRE family protein [Chloroflexota bacterium]